MCTCKHARIQHMHLPYGNMPTNIHFHHCKKIVKRHHTQTVRLSPPPPTGLFSTLKGTVPTKQPLVSFSDNSHSAVSLCEHDNTFISIALVLLCLAYFTQCMSMGFIHLWSRL